MSAFQILSHDKTSMRIGFNTGEIHLCKRAGDESKVGQNSRALPTSANPYMPNNDPYAQMMQQLGAYTAQMDQFNAQMLQQLNGQMYGGGSGFGSMGGSQPQMYGGDGGFGNNSNSFQTPSGFQAPPNGTSTGTSNGGKKENKFWKAFKAGASQIDPATAGEFAGGFVQGAGFDISGFAVGALFGF